MSVSAYESTINYDVLGHIFIQIKDSSSYHFIRSCDSRQVEAYIRSSYKIMNSNRKC